MRRWCEARWVADDSGDAVSGLECLVDELASDCAGGAEDGQLHGCALRVWGAWMAWKVEAAAE